MPGPDTLNLFSATTPGGEASRASIVFADLCGSTGMYESLGNERATKTVTQIVDWIGHKCVAQHGKVIKTLGDGALMRFDTVEDAVAMCVQVQRRHEDRILKWPAHLRAQLQMGIATGEVVVLQGDCFGDAVNVASRLAGLSGAGQIWTDAATIEGIPTRLGIRSRSLGMVTVKGKAEAQSVHLIEWAEQLDSAVFTVPAGLTPSANAPLNPAVGGIELVCLDQRRHFNAEDGPIIIGRDDGAGFQVQDNRVSRQHARIVWQTTPSGGHFVLSDLSSFGTWVRFASSTQEIEVRRGQCSLSGDGELALGAPFSDFSVPTISFSLGAQR
jgi:adenylate cyclase